MQVIEKGMTFVMSHEPYVVGVVQSAKDKAAQRYLVKLTDGSEVIWNNKQKTYNVKRILLPLSEDTKLPSLKEKELLISYKRLPLRKIKSSIGWIRTNLTDTLQCQNSPANSRRSMLVPSSPTTYQYRSINQKATK